MMEERKKTFNESIFLTGFMASGKSSIGKLLAYNLELPFIDLDKYIENKEGAEISSIFTEMGERYFREKEWECLLEVTQQFKGVVSLGGGALQNQNVIDHLKIYGLLVYLNIPMEVILERVQRNKKRPIVLDKNGEFKPRDILFSEMERLYLSRKEFYNQAQVILESTGEESKQEHVARLIKKINRFV